MILLKAFTITAVIVLLNMILLIVLNAATDLGKLKHHGTYKGPLTILTVAQWGGRPEKTMLDRLELPAHRVIISHTAAEGCNSQELCSERAREVQSFHMDSWGWDQIGYNFMVGGDGRVYEGRGWDYVGAHTKGYNRHSIGISFIGTFTKVKPEDRQLKACNLLIDDGVRRKKLDPNYKLHGHRQMSSTESPGEVLYGIIQTWPHWSNDVKDRDLPNDGLVLRLVERHVWIAQPAQKTIPNLQLPVNLVIVMQTNSDGCTSQASCILRVRLRQTYDIESVQEGDIVFNFLIGGDGNVYVGRGWDKMGAHIASFNSRSLSLAFIGAYQTQKPSDKQVSATRLLLEKGVSLGKITPSYRLTGAGNLEPTDPNNKADALYQSFSSWTQWLGTV